MVKKKHFATKKNIGENFVSDYIIQKPIIFFEKKISLPFVYIVGPKVSQS